MAWSVDLIFEDRHGRYETRHRTLRSLDGLAALLEDERCESSLASITLVPGAAEIADDGETFDDDLPDDEDQVGNVPAIPCDLDDTVPL